MKAKRKVKKSLNWVSEDSGAAVPGFFLLLRELSHVYAVLKPLYWFWTISVINEGTSSMFSWLLKICWTSCSRRTLQSQISFQIIERLPFKVFQHHLPGQMLDFTLSYVKHRHAREKKPKSFQSQSPFQDNISVVLNDLRGTVISN